MKVLQWYELLNNLRIIINNFLDFLLKRNQYNDEVEYFFKKYLSTAKLIMHSKSNLEGNEFHNFKNLTQQ